MAPFVLSRAVPHDMKEIVELQYDSFEDDLVHELFMGCNSRLDLPKLVARYTEAMMRDSSDIWIMIKDAATGRTVAASNWKLYLGSAHMQPRGVDDIMPWLKGETALAAKSLLEPMNEIRLLNNQDPFLHLHICFTSPEYRRAGAGSKMMRWGCELADLLFLSAWVEASSEGNFLYKKFGFCDFKQIEHKGKVTGTCMRREARTTRVALTASSALGGIDFGVL